MKLPRKVCYFVFSGFVLITIFAVVLIKPFHKDKDYPDEALISAEYKDPWIDYLLDSTYKIVADSQITIYKVKTGEKISSLSMPWEPIRSMAMHPSASHLAVLGEYTLQFYDLKKDDVSNEDTTATWSSDAPELDVYDKDAIEFSDDGKFLLVIDYQEADVTIFIWPELKELTTENMGGYRNSFYWENKNGQLIFYYEVYRGGKAYYRTRFPADPKADSLYFSKPDLIDSLPSCFSNVN
ncbi:MAG: hypothetical protein NT004_07955 [Bacteroidetes bacterium]|nr:hypothetical protein [Bacteroidota bacterium]